MGGRRGAGTPARGIGRISRAAGPPLRSAASPARCPPLTDPHASQLQAVLGYRAKQLLAELEHGDPRATLAGRLTATSAALLRWWFASAITRTREDNFHPGQREAILHVVLAHEIFGDCDPERLAQRATGACPDATAGAAPDARERSTCDMRLALRCAPGAGQRWVLQALLIWQWANHMSSRAAGCEDARFSDRFAVLVPVGRQQDWEDALLGTPAVAGLRCVGDASVLRRTRLFLPPALRAPYRFWLMMQACAGDALRVQADDADGTTATLVAGRGPRLSNGLPAPAFSGQGAVPLRTPASLRVTWRDPDAPPCTENTDHGACVADFGDARAIRYGVAKLPALSCAPSRLRLRAIGSRPAASQPSARPMLHRDHAAQLRIGLRALAHRTRAFASIDEARAPRMRVLCETPALVRAARTRLVDLGVAIDEIACNLDAGARSRDITLGAKHGRIHIALISASLHPDPRTCVLVVLRSTAPQAGEAMPAAATGTPAMWPEPELARLRAANRERAAFGQPPDNLLDVLTVIEHRDALPLYTPWLRQGLAVRDSRPPEAAPPTGDAVMTTLRRDAARFEIALPPLCADIAAMDTPERLSDQPRRLLRSSRALPVHKSIHPLAGWHEDDNGLRRGFIEAAELDPRIDSHCLLDPRRQACRHRDTLLALGMDGRGRVDALARTATHVFLVEFLPDRPTGAAPRHDGGERALRLWRRRTNTLPADQRDERLWRQVKLQAPLFWSCKRHGVPLSALLEALASTRSLMPPATGQSMPAC